MTAYATRYQVLGDAAWALIRAEYLGGATAPELARRYGVTPDAIYKKATRKGWTKRAYAKALDAMGASPPPPLLAPGPRLGVKSADAPAAPEPPEPPDDPLEIGRVAIARASLSIHTGAVVEVERLVRIAKSVEDLFKAREERRAAIEDPAERREDADAVVARLDRAMIAAEIEVYTSAWAGMAAHLGIPADAGELYADELAAAGQEEDVAALWKRQ